MMNDSWIAYRKPNPTKRFRLFCFSYAGGGASIYRPWIENLPALIDVCPIQLPGRENRIRETPYSQIAPLAEALSQQLQPYLDLPFAFFGHSLGALVSFEVTRRLREQQLPLPLQLLVSACRAPQLPSRLPHIHRLPPEEMKKELSRYNGTPGAVLENNELMELMLPILRADFAICETYTFKDEPPLSCPISALGGLQDETVSRNDLAAWQEQTTGTFRLRMFSGDHFYLHSDRLQLLTTLSQELAQHLYQSTL